MRQIISKMYVRTGLAVTLAALMCLVDGPLRPVSCFALTDVPPSLSGEKAVQQLKQTGRYGSLMDAFNATRKKDGQTEQIPTQDSAGQSAKLTASEGGTNDNFGYSVAVAGDTAIVGSYHDVIGSNNFQGSAYVFVRSGTSWVEQAKIVASDGAAFDGFGVSVAISGDTVVVGSFLDDIAPNANQGSAYIFVRTGTLWSEQQKLTAADGSPNDFFGISASISGNTVVIGAYGDGDTASDQGSAYIVVRSGTTWAVEQKLIAPNPGTNDLFGNSVAIEGDTVIVGAYFDNVVSNIDQGSAYVFVRSGTSWTLQSTLLASDGAPGDRFGTSVALSGQTAIVGAFFDEVGTNADQGSAYIFVFSGTTWTEQQKLTASDGAANDNFGYSVAISGSTAVVGVSFDNIGAYSDQGSAYVFAYSGTWTQLQKLNASDGMADDLFGNCVAISGESIVVGAYLKNVGSNADQGAAYIFRRLSSSWGGGTSVTSATGSVDDQFGISIAISGDRAVVGSYRHDVGANIDQGAAYIFLRTGATWTEQAQLTASDGAEYDRFGNSVAIYGDTVIVGACFDDVEYNSQLIRGQGSAYVFVKIGLAWAEQKKLTALDGETGDQFGNSVGISGDTVIIGVSKDDIEVDDLSTNVDQGSVYIFTRMEEIWIQETKFTDAIAGYGSNELGYSVAIDGNTAIVGAPNFGNDGAAYVLVRQGTLWRQQQRLQSSDPMPGFYFFGTSVAISGDTAIVGTIGYDFSAFGDEGAAFVYRRTGTMWTEQQKLTAADGQHEDRFGISVGISGDTAVVGADFVDIGTNMNQGAAYVFARNGTTWTQEQKLLASGGAANDQFGYSVGISGDKVIVGAFGIDITSFAPSRKADPPNKPLAGVDQGAAFFFVNQLLTPTAASVNVGGRVLSANGFGIPTARVTLTDSAGETRAALTNAFGYYRFEDVAAGQTCVLHVTARRYQFQPMVVTVMDETNELNFMAQNQASGVQVGF